MKTNDILCFPVFFFIARKDIQKSDVKVWFELLYKLQNAYMYMYCMYMYMYNSTLISKVMKVCVELIKRKLQART